MSKRKRPPTTSLAWVAFLGLILAAIGMYLYVEPRSDAALEVWTQFKTLSLIAFGYHFGHRGTAR